MDTGKKKISFPRIAHYDSVIRFFLEKGMDLTYISPPEMTKRTLETGARYSPDFVCAPFKTTLGSEIDALEAGADVLIMSMGLCRLGYYGELQEQILRDLGYEFEMINLSEYSTGNMKDYFKVIRRLNPKIKLARFTKAVIDGLKMLEYIDEIEDLYYQNCGFEVHKGEYKKAWKDFLLAMDMVDNRRDIEQEYKKTRKIMNAIEIRKPDDPIRVGVIGEYFTIMDPFSNLDLEQMLADLGVEVHRWMNVTHRNLHYKGQKNLGIQIADYCNYEMGPTSTANIWCAKKWAENGFDGLIHLKSAGCMPEIDIIPVLNNISRDYKIPILYLTYDTQTSDTGLQTRVEAFYDMLNMRKEAYDE